MNLDGLPLHPEFACGSALPRPTERRSILLRGAPFHISRAPAGLTLAGSNSDETTGLIVTNRLREAATKLATRFTTKFQRDLASRVTADMCLAANSVVLVRLFGIAPFRPELCRAESRSRYLPNDSTKFT